MTNRIAASVVPGVVSAGSVVVMLLGRALGMEVPSRTLLIVASTAFVAVPVSAGAHRSRYGRLVLAGLVGCWIGDYVGPASFLASVVAFAVAHLFFIAAFAVRGLAWRGVVLAAPVLVAAGAAVGAWLLPHVPADLKLPVLAYMLAISAMVTVAAGVRPGAGRWLVVLGAAAFYVSDIFVARWRFVDPSEVNALFCYPPYYAACLMFGFSVLGTAAVGTVSREPARQGTPDDDS
jgi:uncharacterized membrane protein YhhN